MAARTIEQLLELVAAELGLSKSDVTPESSLLLLTEDSLERVSLIQAIETRFEVEFSDDTIQKFHSVRDVAAFLEAQ
jgi:acyl carrier protein